MIAVPGSSARITRAACRPSVACVGGIRMSIIARSGRTERTRASSPGPFPAWPATSNPERSSRLARPSRSRTSSSASTTRDARLRSGAVSGATDGDSMPRLSTTRGACGITASVRRSWGLAAIPQDRQHPGRTVGAGALLLGPGPDRHARRDRHRRGALGPGHDHRFGVVYGVPVWGFAALWAGLATALTLRAGRHQLPFGLTWWSFTFPVGTCVTGTSGLALHTGADAFRWAAVALYLALVAAWAVVSVRTARGAWRGRLFLPPPRNGLLLVVQAMK